MNTELVKTKADLTRVREQRDTALHLKQQADEERQAAVQTFIAERDEAIAQNKRPNEEKKRIVVKKDRVQKDYTMSLNYLLADDDWAQDNARRSPALR